MQTTETNLATAAKSDAHEFVLLRPEDGKLYFIPFQDARWDSTEISLELLPESPEETAFLRSLRRHINDAFARNVFIAFALGEDAAWVKPQEVVQIAYGSQTVWKIILKEERHKQNGSPLGDFTFGTISPDKMAEMRAKRILLDEKLEALPGDFQNRIGPAGLFNETTLEMFVRGGNGFQISASSIPSLYRSFGQTGKRFEKFARLTSVLQLKLSNTVDEILTLDLKLLNSKEVQVGFRGRRPRRYTNVEPSIIEFNGVCPLSQ
jgi:hypothetical protein